MAHLLGHALRAETLMPCGAHQEILHSAAHSLLMSLGFHVFRVRVQNIEHTVVFVPVLVLMLSGVATLQTSGHGPSTPPGAW